MRSGTPAPLQLLLDRPDLRPHAHQCWGWALFCDPTTMNIEAEIVNTTRSCPHTPEEKGKYFKWNHLHCYIYKWGIKTKHIEKYFKNSCVPPATCTVTPWAFWRLSLQMRSYLHAMAGKIQVWISMPKHPTLVDVPDLLSHNRLSP